MTLKISISGVRGITGESLTDDVAADFSKAFASYIKSGKIVVGRDPRRSGEKLKDIIISNLNQLGLDVIYAGIVPTPTVQVLVKELKADGGLIVTASHNPEQWNGLKFVRSDGIFLNEAQANDLIRIYSSREFISSNKKGDSNDHGKPFDAHINKVLKCVNVPQIKGGKFKVVLDSCNGAGSKITPILLKQLGCDVVELNTDIDKPFPHDPEPVPGNLKALCAKVKETKADIGFAQDADADRLAIVTEKGEAPGEEYTLAIATEHVLSGLKSKEPPLVATNLSTSMMVDKIADKYGAKVIRTKVGEVNVAEEMKARNAVIGGEGNGGVMHPIVGYNRDSLVGIALVLDALASTDQKISGVINGLPKFQIVKDKIKCGTKMEAASYLAKVKIAFKDDKLDLTEGVKVIYRDAWVHIRPSNTEPVIRIIAEARSSEEALALIRKVKGQ